ncbi:MAG TPA: hypothetical protein VEL80_00420 [Burkholderiales bacterium]|nr:hypothetical protein [Burkholderiales bacterium]
MLQTDRSSVVSQCPDERDFQFRFDELDWLGIPKRFERLKETSSNLLQKITVVPGSRSPAHLA